MKGRLRYINLDENIFNIFTLNLYEFENKLKQIEKEYDRINLEICCGKGEYINFLARLNKREFFFGLDFSKAAIQRSIKRTIIEENKNVIYLNIDFFDFLNFYLENIKKPFFDNIWISFPDPWPKKRHYKRRLVNIESIKNLSFLLKKDSKLFILTDHPDYAKWIKDACIKNKEIYKEGYRLFFIFKSFFTTKREKYEKYFKFYETTFCKKSQFDKIYYFTLIKK